MQVSQVSITFDEREPLMIGGSNDVTLTIDGHQIHAIKKEILISQINVSRLLKSDLTQASVPIMTYLPLKHGEIKNEV
jgi:hypothetical protein